MTVLRRSGPDRGGLGGIITGGPGGPGAAPAGGLACGGHEGPQRLVQLLGVDG